MPREARLRSNSGIYHIMLRGANRQEIFHEDEDRLKFLNIIKKYKITTEMEVFAWCLMNNHVHLLLKEGNESISNTMKRIGVSFVSYYNLKYDTNGHLFQDRFRSENVETIHYLLTVVRYIHQNPLKAGIVNSAKDWKWSSCSEYYEKISNQSRLSNTDFILKMFSTDSILAKEKFKEFNEQISQDNCLDEEVNERKRLTDDDAKLVIKKMLGATEIVQVKSLPKGKRDEVFGKVKKINGISLRQAARIFGVSTTLLSKAK